MSRRLGAALADHIRRLPGSAKLVLVEGVPTSLAEGMAGAWDPALPPLAVASATPQRFGRYALADSSPTGLRNRREDGEARGVVLVLCEGQQVPDRQSLAFFESVSPDALLESPEGLGMLAQQRPAVVLDGPARAVREAVTRAGAGTRPSAAAVAAYLDRVAAGEDPLRALPALGAFADATAPARVEGDRVGDNLALAARRTSEDLLRPSAYADLRRLAESVLARRPGLGGDREAVKAEADAVLTLLQSGGDELLERLQYDEAREILEHRPQDIVGVVTAELADYRRGLPPGSQAASLPWATYEARAQNLRRGSEQRAAARELLDLDDAQLRQVFSRATRGKLERLDRDRAINASSPSCPEAALARATVQLGGPIERVEVLGPLPPGGGGAATRTAAARVVTLACARLRLGSLMRLWERAGGDVDGLLLKPADADGVADCFSDADVSGPGALPLLQLRLHGEDGSTAQVDWRQDLDDAAVLRAALLFSEQPALTLAMGPEPSLSAFCAADYPAPAPVPRELLPLARRLEALARGALDRGLDSGALAAWADEWASACAEQEAAGATGLAEALALAGAVTGGDRAAALTGLAPLKAEWLGQHLAALRELLDRAETANTETEPVVPAAGGVARATAAHYPAHLRLRSPDKPLLPTSEGRVWSLYGGATTRGDSGYAGGALTSVLARLLALQPEAAGHLRCLAWGPGAADLLAGQAVSLIGTKVGGAVVSKVEIFCVGGTPDSRPAWRTLAWADDELRGSRDVLELRYLDDLDHALRALGRPGSDAPAVHLALVTGITDGGQRLQVELPEVAPPGSDGEVLFAPRVWQRPRQDRRTLLMPPAATVAGHAWLRLQNAVDDAWPPVEGPLRVPEVRTSTTEIAAELQQVHDLALWVATLDRYATRDSLEQALGAEKVAILHQERRLGGDNPLSLVLSQKSGGPADRAIGRSLRASGIVADNDVAMSIGTDLRKVASQGYGILAPASGDERCGGQRAGRARRRVQPAGPDHHPLAAAAWLPRPPGEP